jgi:hypothetical protein
MFTVTPLMLYIIFAVVTSLFVIVFMIQAWLFFNHKAVAHRVTGVEEFNVRTLEDLDKACSEITCLIQMSQEIHKTLEDLCAPSEGIINHLTTEREKTLARHRECLEEILKDLSVLREVGGKALSPLSDPNEVDSVFGEEKDPTIG